MKNKASNEDIRHRWNGHYRNTRATKIFRKEARCCGRLRYLLWGDMEYYHGKSKLDLYTEWVENENKQIEPDAEALIKDQQDDRLQRITNFNVLEDDYGVRIPESDLIQINMDADLLALYR